MSVKLTGVSSVPAVVAEMTVEEKIRLLSGASRYRTAAIPRLGIPAALFIDNGAGVNLRQYMNGLIVEGLLEGVAPNWGGVVKYTNMLNHLADPENLPEDERRVLEIFLDYLKKVGPSSGAMPTVFPTASLLASSWEPAVIEEVGRCVGREACAFGVDMLLGTPGINIQRDPRGGRGFEYFSEDPCVVAKLAPGYVRGVQESGVCADIKHYAANSQETNRKTVSEHISMRALREIYLPGFKACVQAGGAKNVMTAYNWINGTAASEQKLLLEDILRNEWGFDGFVVSDWGGVYNHPAAVKAGNDIRMPARPAGERALEEALEQGTVSVADLDRACTRFLKVLCTMPCFTGKKYGEPDLPASRSAAYRAAAAGMVLLKNEGALPLRADSSTAFYGEHSRRLRDSGIGSGRVYTARVTSVLDAAANLAGAENVTFDRVEAGTKTVVVTVEAQGREGWDRESICLTKEEQHTLRRAIADARGVGAKTVALLNVAGPVDLEEFLPDLDAVLLAYFPGEEGGRAAADILYGRVNPSGKLAQTFPKRIEDCASYLNFPGEYDEVNYGEGIYVGYRWFDARKLEPRFPFGHGLSYTTFRLSEISVDRENFCYEKDPGVTVSLRVKNTGAMAGAEVVQLYLADPVSTLPKPPRQLKAFQKVYLEPGEEKTVSMTLTAEDFAAWDEKLGFTVEPGRYVVWAGTSSRDLPLCAELAVRGKNPYGYTLNTPFIQVFRTQEGREAILSLFPPETFPDGYRDNFSAWFYGGNVPNTRVSVSAFLKNRSLSRMTWLDEEQKAALLQRVADALSRMDCTDLAALVDENEIF